MNPTACLAVTITVAAGIGIQANGPNCRVDNSQLFRERVCGISNEGRVEFEQLLADFGHAHWFLPSGKGIRVLATISDFTALAKVQAALKQSAATGDDLAWPGESTGRRR